MINDVQESAGTAAETEQVSRRSFLSSTGTGALAVAAAALLPAGRAFPQDASKTIRMAVVGGGFGSTFHWHEHPNCRVTAVTDLYPERRKKLSERFHCDTVYDSLEDLLKRAKDVDAVAIFSGAPDHARHAQLCLERGWHVVTAVPACVSLEEAQMLKEVKEKTGLRYMMAESSWYRQENIFARNLFRAGAFGELFYSETEYYHDGGDPDKATPCTLSRDYTRIAAPRFGALRGWNTGRGRSRSRHSGGLRTGRASVGAGRGPAGAGACP